MRQHGYFKKSLLVTILMVVAIFVSTGCKNSSTESTPDEDQQPALAESTTPPPTENATPVAKLDYSPKNIVVGDRVTLDASASSDANGDELKFEWMVNAPNSQIVLVDLTDADKKAEFIADTEGTYQASVTVSDQSSSSLVSSIVEVKKYVEPNKETNSPPVISIKTCLKSCNQEGDVITPKLDAAGIPNITIYKDDSIIFDASASYDPEGKQIKLFWLPNELSDLATAPTGVSYTFAVKKGFNYTLELVAKDEENNQSQQKFKINVIKLESQMGNGPGGGVKVVGEVPETTYNVDSKNNKIVIETETKPAPEAPKNNVVESQLYNTQIPLQNPNMLKVQPKISPNMINFLNKGTAKIDLFYEATSLGDTQTLTCKYSTCTEGGKNPYCKWSLEKPQGSTTDLGFNSEYAVFTVDINGDYVLSLKLYCIDSSVDTDNPDELKSHIAGTDKKTYNFDF